MMRRWPFTTCFYRQDILPKSMEPSDHGLGSSRRLWLPQACTTEGGPAYHHARVCVCVPALPVGTHSPGIFLLLLFLYLDKYEIFPE